MEEQIKEGLFDEALQTSDELISLTRDPYKAAMVRLRKGDIYLYKADPPKALEVYAEALDQAGQGSWLENQICSQIEQVFDRNDDPNGLKDYLTGLVKAHPERIGLKKRLAGLLVSLGRADQSLTLLKEVLDVTPGDETNQRAYAAALAEAGQLDRALSLLQPALQDTNPDRETLIRLAELYHRNRQDDEVRVPLDRLLDLSGKAESAYLQVGGILEQYELKDQAEAVYRQRVKDLPGSRAAQQDLAEFLCRVNKEEEALDLFKTLARTGDLQAMIQACDAAAARGHPDLALEWAEARGGGFSEDPSYVNHLCKLALRLKAWDKAVLWARRQLDKAQTFTSLGPALSQVMAGLNTAEQKAALIRELEAAPARTIQQTCLLSELLESQGQSDRADAVLSEAARAQPQIVLRQQAHLYCLRRDWTRAAATLESLVTRSGPSDLDLRPQISELYAKAGQYDAGLKWVLEWEKGSPASAAPRVAHAQLLHSLGRGREALPILEGADHEFGGRPEILTPLAALYASLGHHAEAVDTYWRLHEATKDTQEKLRWVQAMSEVAGQAGLRQRLIEKLDREHQANRASAIPLLALAEVYKQSGQYERRRQALLEATQVQTDDLSLIHELAAVEEAQGDWEKAVQTLRRAMPRDSTTQTRVKMARLYIRHGSPDEGFRLLSEAVAGGRVDPRDAESIAASILSTGAWTDAARFLRPLVAQYPQDYRLGYQHAVALEEAGSRQGALEAHINLLGIREELPGNTAARTSFSWSRQGLDVDLQKLLPSGAVDLLRISQSRDKAYAYRNARRATPYWGMTSPGGTTAYVAVPSCVEDLQDFSLSHILTLAEDLSDPERARLEVDLNRQGVADAAVLTKIGRFGGDLRGTIDELASAYPDDRTVMAVWSLLKIEGGSCTLEQAQRVFTLFEKTHPRLALCIGLRCTGTDPIAPRLRDRALEMLQAIPDPGYYEVTSIAYALQNEEACGRLTEDRRDFLDNHLVGWAMNLRKTGPARTDLFSWIAALLASRPDLTEYVQFLDNEIAHYRQASSSPPSGSSEPVIRPLLWPPGQLPGIPSHVLRGVAHPVTLPRLNVRVNRLPVGARVSVTSGSTRGPLPQTLDPARLGPYVDKAKDPTLKVLLAMAAGRRDQAETLAQGLIDRGRASPACCLLAATVAGQRGQSKQAMTLLEKARALPLSQEDQRSVDGAIVAYAMELDPNDAPAEVALGRAAVNRLIRDRLGPVEREELLVAAETLGLTEQAENLRTQILAAPVSSRPAYGPPIDLAAIERFLKGGNMDSALRLARDGLVSEARQSLYPSSRFGSTPLTTRLADLLRRYNAADKLVERVAPSDQATVRRTVEYGRVCELVGREKEALAAYERALAQEPNDPAARIQMAVLAARSDPNSGAGHLAAIGIDRMSVVGPWLAGLVAGLYGQEDVKPALDVADAVTIYLGRLRDPNALDLGWIDRVAEAISGPHPFRPGWLNSLYQGVSPPSRMVSFQMSGSSAGVGVMSPMRAPRFQTGQNRSAMPPEEIKTARIRKAVHDRLCRKMLEVPQLAEAGYSRLATAAKAADRRTDEFAAMARRALLRAKPASRAGVLAAAPASGTTAQGQRSGLVRPVEVLVQHAFREGTLSGVVGELAVRLKQNQRDDLAEELAGHAELYTVAPAGFFDSATRLVGTWKAQGRSKGLPGLEEDSAVRWAIDAYVARGLDKDDQMSQWVLDEVKEDAAQGHPWPVAAGQYWLFHLSNKNSGLAQEFLGRLAALLGPGPSRMALLPYGQASNQVTWSTTLPVPNATVGPSRTPVQRGTPRGASRADPARDNRRRPSRRALP
ncbi:MAG: tetratricopeptide repeat protein [Phycisphaerae bacterium]|nr:tetratricopeptide repeat protein [Phycisphaerae bacterium]